MTTTNNRRTVILGIFILLGLAIFVAGILTLGGQKKTFEKKLPIIAVFKDVGGLQVGNNIWYLGVKVGTIKKMTFTDKSEVEVVMNIDIKSREHIKKDSKAKIGSEGFIGNKLVVIYGGSLQSPPVVENDVLQVENGLNTDEIMATFQQNNKNLVDVTGDFKLISKRLAEGQGTIGKLLTDDALVNNLQAAVINFKKASLNAQKLTADLSGYTARLQSKGSLTNELVSDTVIFGRLKAAVVELHQASKTANDIANKMKGASNNIQEVTNNLNGTKSPIGILLNDQAAGANLKATLANLNGGTKKLDENMEALQHNFLLRGFFKKKAKEEKKLADTLR